MLIVNQEHARIRISGVIGQDVLADELAEALYEFGGKALRIDLQSPGGLVDEGMAMYDLLRDYEGEIEVRLQGIVGSIATIVMLGGSEVVASEASQVFVHDAWAVAIGNSKELRSVANDLEGLSTSMAELYAKHSTQTLAFWTALMDEETFLSPEEAVAAGLVHRIAEGGARNSKREDFAPVARVRAPVATFGGDAAKLRVRIERLRSNA